VAKHLWWPGKVTGRWGCLCFVDCRGRQFVCLWEEIWIS
jgi:hypothetical protein